MLVPRRLDQLYHKSQWCDEKLDATSAIGERGLRVCRSCTPLELHVFAGGRQIADEIGRMIEDGAPTLERGKYRAVFPHRLEQLVARARCISAELAYNAIYRITKFNGPHMYVEQSSKYLPSPGNRLNDQTKMVKMHADPDSP